MKSNNFENEIASEMNIKEQKLNGFINNSQPNLKFMNS